MIPNNHRERVGQITTEQKGPLPSHMFYYKTHLVTFYEDDILSLFPGPTVLKFLSVPLLEDPAKISLFLTIFCNKEQVDGETKRLKLGGGVS
jgi:RsiW-degrading membrane proteinase PrsW (M82 family)